MIARICKFIPSSVKEKLLTSHIYRILSRIRLHNPEIRVSCELTTKCNAECDICTRSSLVKNGRLYIGDMPDELVKSVVQEIRILNQCRKRVCFMPMGLGEPLLYKGLLDLFRKIKNISKIIKIVLVTNGILLDENCCKNLISLGIEEVSISLNVNNESNYFQHMGINMYDKVCSNIERLIKLRNRNSSRSSLPSVFIQYINYDNNQSLFNKDIRRWLKIMRFSDKCYIHPVVNQAGFLINGKDFKRQTKKYPCVQPHSIIAIKVNGDMYPCCSCFYSGCEKIDSLYLGNIQTTSISHLIDSKNSKCSSLIEMMRKNDYSQLPECKKCNVYKLNCNCYFGLPGSLRIKGYRWV